jgi:hypothetical protein
MRRRNGKHPAEYVAGNGYQAKDLRGRAAIYSHSGNDLRRASDIRINDYI